MGLVDSVFDRKALETAFDSVLEAMRSAQRAHVRDPAAHKRKIQNHRDRRSEMLDRIITRHEGEGTLRFTRFVTKIPKVPGGTAERPISLFSFEERIILRSLLDIVWPLLEVQIVPSVSYCTFRKLGGLHPERGIAKAVQTISEERRGHGYHIFETDIKAFFDRIDRVKLLDQATSILNDDSLTEILQAMLYAETEFDKRFADDSPVEADELGVPQGAALSPLLACTYLSPFDKHMESNGFKMFRYVDDLVILGTEAECRQAECLCRDILKSEYGLDVHPDPTKTKHVQPNEALIFLGHEIYPDGILKPSPKRRTRVANHVYKTICGYKADYGLIKGLPGANQDDVINKLSGYLLGYFGNMSHCNWTVTDYAEVVGYITGALKSRGLQMNRLSKGLRKASKKWPPEFLEALP